VTNVEGWLQVGELGLGLALSGTIGLEREIRQKSAGLRTHTLVGVGAALFMLISKYGFSDVLLKGLVVVDPSRVAAQSRCFGSPIRTGKACCVRYSSSRPSRASPSTN
jgi:hypothetical protein